MLLTSFFIGLGIVYLAFTFILIFAQFREDQQLERLQRKVAVKSTVLDVLDTLGDQSDATA